VPTAREVENAIAVLLGSKVAAEATKAALATKRAVQVEGLGATALRGGRFLGRQAITKNPWGIAAVLAYEGYIHRDEIADVATGIIESAGGFPEPRPTGAFPIGAVTTGLRAGPSMIKRKVSRANRAVKEGMRIMKSGGKATTGASPGKLSKTAFKTVTKAAGLANPKTKSVIGKGKTMVKKLARRLRKWW